jgi:hypothetical protein
VVDRDGEGR